LQIRVFLLLAVIKILNAQELATVTATQTMMSVSGQSSMPASTTTHSQLTRSCVIAVFDVIELKMNRTKTVHVPVGTSIRYNTLVLQPKACTVQHYAGDHQNTTISMDIGVLPYTVMVDPMLADKIRPSLVFQGPMSTITPTFANPDYAIIPKGCQMIPCTAR
jgi:hypothetical protein